MNLDVLSQDLVFFNSVLEAYFFNSLSLFDEKQNDDETLTSIFNIPDSNCKLLVRTLEDSYGENKILNIKLTIPRTKVITVHEYEYD